MKRSIIDWILLLALTIMFPVFGFAVFLFIYRMDMKKKK